MSVWLCGCVCVCESVRQQYVQDTQTFPHTHTHTHGATAPSPSPLRLTIPRVDVMRRLLMYESSQQMPLRWALWIKNMPGSPSTGNRICKQHTTQTKGRVFVKQCGLGPTQYTRMLHAHAHVQAHSHSHSHSHALTHTYTHTHTLACTCTADCLPLHLCV